MIKTIQCELCHKPISASGLHSHWEKHIADRMRDIKRNRGRITAKLTETEIQSIKTIEVT